MDIPMCRSVMYNLCEFVINDVMENVREHFRNEGLDDITLKDFKGLWKEKLLETKAVEKIEIKNTLNEKFSKPVTIYRKLPQKVLTHTTQESAIRPQVAQVGQPQPVINQVSRQNASNNVQNQYLNLQSVPIRPALPVVMSQVGQPQPVINQVSRQNASNNVQNQYLNLQSVPIRPILPVVMSQVGQPQPVINQVSHQNASNNVLIQRISFQELARRLKNHHNPLQPVNQVVQSPQGINPQVQYVRNPVPTNSQQFQISSQPNYVYLLNNPGLSVGSPAMQTVRGITNQHRFRNSNPIAGNHHYVPQVQNFAVRLPNSGMTNQRHQNIIVRQPSSENLVSTANTQTPNFQNSYHHQQGLNQQFLTMNPFESGFTGMVPNQVPVNTTTNSNVASGRRQVRRSATAVRNMSQGNLIEITPPVGQSNLNPFDQIIQTDGSVDEIDNVELMSDSDLDDSCWIEVDHITDEDDAVQNTNEVVENDDTHVSDKSDDDIQSSDKDDLLLSDDDVDNDSDDEDDGEPPLNSNDDGEPPLNSDDDLSIESTEDLFDSDNVIICEYEKVIKPYRLKKQLWKMHMKNGFMFLNSKEYVFKSAFLETTFLTFPW